ncbi:MAG: hypothetical protein M3P18_18600 [Actinomycetota bacterium]|nr:hypothetical protein [Actinomycetota bacterium]
MAHDDVRGRDGVRYVRPSPHDRADLVVRRASLRRHLGEQLFVLVDSDYETAALKERKRRGPGAGTDIQDATPHR